MGRVYPARFIMLRCFVMIMFLPFVLTLIGRFVMIAIVHCDNCVYI